MTVRFTLLLLGVACIGSAQATVPPAMTAPGEDDAPAVTVAPSIRSPERPANEPAVSPNPLWAVPLKQLSNTRERPLFSPSRRPPPTAVGPAIEAAKPRVVKLPEPLRPQLSLIGTVIGEKDSIAVFVDDTTKNSIRLRTGEEHKGWTLRSVQGREVTLERDRENTVLSLPAPGTEQTASIRSPQPIPSQPVDRRRNSVR
jgi:hypothetical protein